MASVQERLQLKRTATDQWTTREQLCLASAVACSGDQNWMSVSRSLKLLCGNNRPNDWFSQKSCAVQYGKLLENVETPKRKKRTSESSSTAVAETPTESILRQLTQDRIIELRSEIQKKQEEYVNLREDILLLQNGTPTEEKLMEMWSQIEQEMGQKVLEQQKYKQFLKEREEQKVELQKAWRPGTLNVLQQQPIAGPSTSQQQQQQSLQTKPAQLNLNIKSEEFEGDDSNSSSSKPGTSPLLTSLLKSPSPAPSTSSNPVPSVSSVLNVRSVAPTITNLLTGNNTQIQQIVTTPTPSTSGINLVQNKPLTGPTPVNSQPQAPPTTPSKSAPTLSMLLENRNKENLSTVVASATTEITTPNIEMITSKEIKSEALEQAIEIEENDDSITKSQDQQLMEVFNELIPDNIDELADILEEESILRLIGEEQEEEKDNLKSEISEDDINKSLVNDIKESEDQSKVKDLNEEVIDIKESVKEEKDPLQEEIEPKLKSNSDVKIQDNENEVAEINEANRSVDILPKKRKLEDDDNNEPIKVLKVEEKSQSLEISDDSSDNTTLQVLKEKITTISECNTSEETEEIKSVKNEEPKCDNDSKLESENENVVMEIPIENVEEIKEENNVLSMEEEKTIDEPLRIEDDSNSKSEVININNDNDIIEEQKKSPSESSVIVIQEDDDSTSAEKVVLDKISEKDDNIQKEVQDKVKDNQCQEKNEEVSIIQNDEKQKVTEEEKIQQIPEIHIESSSSSSSSTTVTETRSKSKPNSGIKNNSNGNNREGNTATEITTTIVIDTDEESPVEIVKEEIITPRTKRDYSRKKLDTSTNSNSNNANNNLATPTVNISISTPSSEKRTVDETTPTPLIANEDFRPNLTIKRLKERERSESPLVDDETIDSMPRTRRRYSSTPVFDSIPNSPASSDDKEYKAWKKSTLMIYNRLTIHKNSSIFLRPVTDDLAPNYKQIVHRPMDLHTIKKNIENGTIRTTAEFQRDVMLMCQNAIMYNQTNNNVYNMAKEMWADSVNVIESLIESIKKETNDRSSLSSGGGNSHHTSLNTSKSRGRKSYRLN